MGVDLSDYVDVAERIERFYSKYPNGSLRCKRMTLETVGDATYLVYVALAYREPDDAAPAEGSAWEPVPGKTPYTRDSELMNAETSAWGRAIAALGFEVKRGIASRQEVANRREASGGLAIPAAAGFVSTKQKTLFDRLLRAEKVSSNDIEQIHRFVESIPSSRVSSAIDGLKEKPKATVDALLTESQKFVAQASDVPWDEGQ